MTVRRDLDVLADAGLVTKVHGGATMPDQHSADEPGFEAKSLRNTEQKSAIAARRRHDVTPGAGDRHHRRHDDVPARLRARVDIANLIVVTNTIRVAEVLTRKPRPDRTVVLTGGVRTPTDALVGPVAVRRCARCTSTGVHGRARHERTTPASRRPT